MRLDHIYSYIAEDTRYTRDEMPQISKKHLKKAGIPFRRKTVLINQLIPVQKERVEGLVDKTVDDMITKKNKRPLIVSKDFEIVNGHHRYDAAKKLGLIELDIFLVDRTLDQLVREFSYLREKQPEHRILTPEQYHGYRQHNDLHEASYIEETWFHGTPDAKEVEKQSGFSDITTSVTYVSNPTEFDELQKEMSDAREEDFDLYFSLLQKAQQSIHRYRYKKPVFLSDKYSVAKTYANPRRAFDYQGAEEKVFEVEVDCNKIVKIDGLGRGFQFIGVDQVKKGFMNAGVSEKEIDTLISMFNYYVSDNSGIQTDVIGAIGNWLKFDCIDVKNTLDSHHGGEIRSTIRMVLNPATVKLKRGEDMRASQVTENTKPYFLKDGELRGSWQDDKLAALGFRKAVNGSWYISQAKWKKLLQVGERNWHTLIKK